MFEGGSRVVFRKSGTGTVGMTLRVYMERYCEAKDISMSRDEALQPIVDAALAVSQIVELTGFATPSVIT
jgi:phosphoglucomutase